MTKPGFTLISVLLTMMIMASMMVLTLRQYVDVNNDHFYFMNDYLSAQSDAIANKEDEYLNGYDIHFNTKGHVNKAQTISFDKHSVIVHLGNGYLSYE